MEYYTCACDVLFGFVVENREVMFPLRFLSCRVM